MLLKYCQCGAVMPANRERCVDCERRRVSRHTRYNQQQRSAKAAAFYVSPPWLRLRPRIIAAYDGLDIWALHMDGKLATADIVHHIEELEQAWDRRLDPFNLIPLSSATHTKITALYHRSSESMKDTQQQLLALIARHFEDRGGIKKVYERAGIVAPPFDFEKTPH